jgi:hypothetical protein
MSQISSPNVVSLGDERESGVHGQYRSLRVYEVTAERELDQVQRKRYEVLHGALGLPAGNDAPEGRIVCADDASGQVRHFYAMAGGECVGTASLRFVEQPGDLFEMESSFVLSGIQRARCAEVFRLCIDKGRGAVLSAFKATFLEVARDRALEGLIAEVDLRTNDPSEGDRILELVAALGWMAQGRPIVPRSQSRELPETLRVFRRYFKAQVLGTWGVHPSFPRLVVPVFAPTSTEIAYPSAIPRK